MSFRFRYSWLQHHNSVRVVERTGRRPAAQVRRRVPRSGSRCAARTHWKPASARLCLYVELFFVLAASGTGSCRRCRRRSPRQAAGRSRTPRRVRRYRGVGRGQHPRRRGRRDVGVWCDSDAVRSCSRTLAESCTDRHHLYQQPAHHCHSPPLTCLLIG